METKAKITDISRDFRSGSYKVTFLCDNAQPEVLQELSGSDLRLTVKKWREKRSLNANAYFHVLVGKLAEKHGTSHTYMHNLVIAKYGYVDTDVMTVILRDDIDYLELEHLHLRPSLNTKTLDDGKLYRVYFVMRGSHTYDTAEMARLIDGTVDDCKASGIETLSPDEIERMKNSWKG